MKALFLALTISASFNVMADASAPFISTANVVRLPFATTGASVLGLGTSSSGADCMLGQARCKAAVQILDDSQEFFQNGNMSLLLSEKVKQLQELNESLSEEQAVDELVAMSLEILK